MQRYVEMWTYTESFGTPRWTEEWELVSYPSESKTTVLKTNWIILDMEMIRTSKKHCCVRKVYALHKDGYRHLQAEFVPCVAFADLSSEDKNSYKYCYKKVHGLPYYPARYTRSAPCLKAKHVLQSFIADTCSEVILYKGGIFEKRISADIGVESFNIERLGIQKVNSHDPKEEVHLHYGTLKWMINAY